MAKSIVSRSYLFILFSFLGGLVLLFIIAPILKMMLSSSFPSLFNTVKDAEVGHSLLLTLSTSMGATLVFSIMAIPLAWMLARHNFRGKRLVKGLIDIPIVVPHSAAGIAILGFINRETAMGKAAGFLGFDLVGHPVGIALAMAFVSLPFLINAAHDGFEAVPERLEKAALSLGASPAKVFFSVSMPLAWRSILSGMILMFARGMSEFGAVVIVAYHPMITPVLIWERFSSFGLGYAQPVSVVFLAICLAIFVVLRYFSRKDSYASRS